MARWLKHEGDKVEKGDILLEIETDKATMELEAYEAGVVEQVMVQEGQTVQIGEPIARIGSGDGAKTNGAATQEEQPPAQEEAPTDEESTAPPAAARKEQRQE